MGIWFLILVLPVIIIYFALATVFLVVIPRSRSKKLNYLLDTDSTLYLEKINNYIRKTKDKCQISRFQLSKLEGLRRLNKWEEMQILIEELDINYFNSIYLQIYCNEISETFFDGQAKLADNLIDKVNAVKNIKPLNNFKVKYRLKLIMAIKNYYNKEYKKSKDLLLALLPEIPKSDYENRKFLFYFLSETCRVENDLEKSKEYYQEYQNIVSRFNEKYSAYALKAKVKK